MLLGNRSEKIPGARPPGGPRGQATLEDVLNVHKKKAAYCYSLPFEVGVVAAGHGLRQTSAAFCLTNSRSTTPRRLRLSVELDNYPRSGRHHDDGSSDGDRIYHSHGPPMAA